MIFNLDGGILSNINIATSLTRRLDVRRRPRYAIALLLIFACWTAGRQRDWMEQKEILFGKLHNLVLFVVQIIKDLDVYLKLVFNYQISMKKPKHISIWEIFLLKKISLNFTQILTKFLGISTDLPENLGNPSNCTNSEEF